MMTRTIVYTAIMGGYDLLPEVTNKEEIEYYCFTDSIPEDTNGWTCIYVAPFFKDNKLNVNYLKTNAHLLFPWDSVVVWVDSNLDKVELTKSNILTLVQDQLVATLFHRYRQTVFGEIAVVAEYNLDNRNKLSKWELELKSMEYPDDDKLSELSFLIRDIRSPEVRRFNETWWRFLINGSRRDQLSFNPALWYHNMSWKAIKADNNSVGESEFEFSFGGHSNPSKRMVPGNASSFNPEDFTPFCWTEFHPSINKRGKSQYHHLYQQEFWTKETLYHLRMLNHMLERHTIKANENYCFIEKTNIGEYSVPDIRYGWKREYFRKSILPSKWGLEIGFRQGHSAAIALGYNPNLKIVAIEEQPDAATYACAEVLTGIYRTRLEIYYGNTGAVMGDLLQTAMLEKVEFVHYNVPPEYNKEEFWGFLEWYLCKATLGCRLIISDMLPEINSVLGIVYSLAVIDYIDPGIPFMGEVRQMIKIVHLESEQFNEMKSWHISGNDAEVEKSNTRTNNVAYEKINKTLLVENNNLRQANHGLKQEIEYFKNLMVQFERPSIFFYRKTKAYLKRILKKIFF